MGPVEPFHPLPSSHEQWRSITSCRSPRILQASRPSRCLETPSTSGIECCTVSANPYRTAPASTRGPGPKACRLGVCRRRRLGMDGRDASWSGGRAAQCVGRGGYGKDTGKIHGAEYMLTDHVVQPPAKRRRLQLDTMQMQKQPLVRRGSQGFHSDRHKAMLRLSYQPLLRAGDFPSGTEEFMTKSKWLPCC